MTDREVDLIIAEQNKSTEEILKTVEKVKSDIQESCNLKEERIKQLERENAELKERLLKNEAHKIIYPLGDITKAKAIIGKLSKSLFLAKGIIRDLIDDTVDFKESKERAIYCYEQEMFDTYKEAEQFLKENG